MEETLRKQREIAMETAKAWEERYYSEVVENKRLRALIHQLLEDFATIFRAYTYREGVPNVVMSRVSKYEKMKEEYDVANSLNRAR